MIEPKIFYRELDEMLASIRKEESGENFLITILQELENRFGNSLRIFMSHLFELRGKTYTLIHTTGDDKKVKIKRKFSVEDSVIQLVQTNRSYIYNRPEIIASFFTEKNVNDIIPAAITVNNPEKKWIFVFELSAGWVWEEIVLFLNAVRTALNYRLFSEMITTDLQRSVQIQKSLLPKQAPKVTEYDVFAQSQAAELVGGDFYDYFEFDDHSFSMSIGDASGHGLPAALLVRDVVIGLRMGLAKEMRLVYTIKKLNQVIQQSTYSTNFVSLFVAEFEKDGHLFYINAGHPPPFIISKEGCTALNATGITLGFLSEIDISRAYNRLQPGDVLVSYTDGIVERNNTEDEMFGVERLRHIVQKNLSLSSEAIVEKIFQEVYRFGNETNWEDDATLVVVKRIGDDRP